MWGSVPSTPALSKGQLWINPEPKLHQNPEFTYVLKSTRVLGLHRGDLNIEVAKHLQIKHFIFMWWCVQGAEVAGRACRQSYTWPWLAEPPGTNVGIWETVGRIPTCSNISFPPTCHGSWSSTIAESTIWHVPPYPWNFKTKQKPTVRGDILSHSNIFL